MTESPSDIVAAGFVISQTIAPNVTVDSGTAVDFVVSTGPENALPALYSCNLDVKAPDAYAGGIAVVTLTQNDTGIQLHSANTTSFPVNINLSNIQGSPECTLAIRYTIEVVSQRENEDGTNERYTTTEEKVETRQITLTKQSQ